MVDAGMFALETTPRPAIVYRKPRTIFRTFPYQAHTWGNVQCAQLKLGWRSHIQGPLRRITQFRREKMSISNTIINCQLHEYAKTFTSLYLTQPPNKPLSV